ncbi:MAG: HDOD domain-containing protein [Pseudomonadota bacterium]
MINQQEFLNKLQKAIKENRIVLPTLPEVALKVRDAVGKPGVSAKAIATIITTDPALSARLLQVANSPLYRGRMEVDSVQMAVMRLGNNLVRTLVASLAMKQIFQATSDALDRRFRASWQQSVSVAALSHFLALSNRHLDADQAMLGGLIHNIGALPIFVMAENDPALTDNPMVLNQLVDFLGPLVGCMILNAWNFPETLKTVATHCRNLAYDSASDKADYADVVMVARLQSLIGSEHPDADADWSQVPAFAKVGMEPEVVVMEMEGAAQDVQEIRGILGG